MTPTLVSSQPSKQQLVDYTNAISKINSYAYAITNQSLPPLTEPPANYASFGTQFVPAKQHALNWSMNLFPLMLQFPQTINQQAANLFDLEASMINPYLNALIKDPTDAKAKAGLAEAIGSLVKLIDTQQASVKTIATGLTDFSTDIATDATTLSKIATEATADAGADSTLIGTIGTDIDTLRNNISSAQQDLTIAEIGIGASILVGLVGAVCCFIPGAQGVGAGLVVAGVAGLGGSIALTVIESKTIAALNNEVTADQNQISNLNQDIIILQGVSRSFIALHGANQAAQKSLITIEAMWTNLQTELNAVKTELTDTSKDATSSQYQKAKSDFAAASDNWADVAAFAKALADIDFKWQDSKGAWHNYTDQAPTADGSKVDQIPSTISKAA